MALASLPIVAPVSLKLPSNSHALWLRSMVGKEELGRPFVYDLELHSHDHSIDLNAHLGEPWTVRLEIGPDQFRFFNGIVTHFEFVESGSELATYRAVLRPILWLLTKHTDCRIYKKRSVIDVVKKILGRYGIAVEEKLGHKDQYAPVDYIVQYNESDFNFVSRLLEENGVYYFFRHEETQHTLVLCDWNPAHSATPGTEKLAFQPPDAHRSMVGEYVDRWQMGRGVESDLLSVKDFDFERPLAFVGATVPAPASGAIQGLEHYEYPAGDLQADAIERRLRIRIEEMEAGEDQVAAHTNARNLLVGALFNLLQHPRAELNREYLVTGAKFRIRAHETSSAKGDEEETYRCQFTAISTAKPFRPRRSTPKPRVPGPQTAVVVGKPTNESSDEELWTDPYGRVKVRFHWYRAPGDPSELKEEQNQDEDSSCWVRVSQVWAGPNWGAMHIPRVGQEVIVDFLDGDPDRPIITGRVYNANNMPPFELPKNQTQSGIKSRSTKKGTPANFNEIRFEDKKGSEDLFIHAENTQTTIVKGSQSISVGGDRSLHVTGKGNVHVEKTRGLTVEKANSFTFNDTHTVTVEKKVTETYKDEHELNVTGKQTVTLKNDKIEHVTGNFDLTADARYHLTQGKNILYFESGGIELTAGKGFITIDCAGNSVKLEDSGKITVSASDEINLEVGSTAITISKDGSIKVTGSKEIVMESGSSKISVKPSAVDVTATAINLNA